MALVSETVGAGHAVLVIVSQMYEGTAMQTLRRGKSVLNRVEAWLDSVDSNQYCAHLGTFPGRKCIEDDDLAFDYQIPFPRIILGYPLSLGLPSSRENMLWEKMDNCRVRKVFLLSSLNMCFALSITLYFTDNSSLHIEFHETLENMLEQKTVEDCRKLAPAVHFVLGKVSRPFSQTGQGWVVIAMVPPSRQGWVVIAMVPPSQVCDGKNTEGRK